MEQLSTLNTTEPIDFDNLNIIIRPRPRRRRQSGISLVPFRPYVKCLTSVQQPFSFTNGTDSWKQVGQKQTGFKQENARCIGSLLDDCDISDVIRWDIAGDSTRLPMMCKLWIIVDGAVIERGKPHLVQDAAIQVFKTGRNRSSLLAAEQRYKSTAVTKFDRRRRHSWHDVNEYHSVPYYQYTRSIRLGHQETVQCDLDDEQSLSTQEYLPFIVEEIADEQESFPIKREIALETVQNEITPTDRVNISKMTQTEHTTRDKSTEIESDFIQLFNLNSLTNENFLSSITDLNNGYYSNVSHSETTTFTRNNKTFKNQSVSTGVDYPDWWNKLPTNVLLSSIITNQGEEKSKYLPYPSPRRNQLTQTDTQQEIDPQLDKERLTPYSPKSPSSTLTTNNHYEIIDDIDDGNNARRVSSCINPSQRIDSPLSDYQTETLPNRNYERGRRITTSSKQSDSDYNTCSMTSDAHNRKPSSTCSTYETNRRVRTKSSESTSTNLFSTLSERYERTLRERQRAVAVVNNELLNIDDVLNRYREKIYEPTTIQTDTSIRSNRDMSIVSSRSKEELLLSSTQTRKERPLSSRSKEELLLSSTQIRNEHPLLSTRIRDECPLSSRSKEERLISSIQIRKEHPLSSTRIREECPLSSRSNDESQSSSRSISRITRDKYRLLPSITSKEMLQCYVPLPQVYMTNSTTDSPPQHQSRFDYCDLCLSDHNSTSAWIRYNEKRIDELQKRIDLMLQIDDIDEANFFLSKIYPTTSTVTQRIDDILMRKPKYRNRITYYHDQLLLPRRYNFHLPYRTQKSSLRSPRIATRTVSRSTTPILKTVRISKDPASISDETCFLHSTSKSDSRPVVSILRRNHQSSKKTRERRVVDPSHVWKSDIDGKVYILEQFSIPRYYRLYNDVSFREVYNFSRILDVYSHQSGTTPEKYSLMIRNYALTQHLPTIKSIA